LRAFCFLAGAQAQAGPLDQLTEPNDLQRRAFELLELNPNHL
jgi:hypothetical protein